jgi:glycosyltransferase involved in cell wall biosynthesis
VPIKIMSRRSLSGYQQNWPMVARVERLLHGRMDAVTGNSGAVVGQLRAEGIPEAKLRLIYNGIDIDARPPSRVAARQQLDIDPDAFVGVIVANLIPYKGHHDLINGLATVRHQLPYPWCMLVAGRDHGLQHELEALAHHHGIAANIQFLGERSDVSRLLAAADIGLLTSHQEGFSNAILEAMAAELPVIVTEVGGNPEAVLHERTGLVVPAQNPGTIGKAVIRLARDPLLRTRLGGAARARVEQEFSLNHCVRAHSELYEALLAKHAPVKSLSAAQHEVGFCRSVTMASVPIRGARGPT